MTDDTDPKDPIERTPGKGRTPVAREIEPDAPDEFGQTQVWWGDGKGKTTAALGMAIRAAGHGYRVHLLQFMKGGASSVEDVRGEYNAIAKIPGLSYENTGNYGWHRFVDGSDDDEHEAKAKGGLERAREIVDGAREVDLTAPLDLEADPEEGAHMLILDEILYAANRELIDPEDVLELVREKPEGLELVLTGGHERPAYVLEDADLVTNVRKEKHPIDAGQRARKGTEY
ncbi:cob(I)yrinic acid a,c-diamide adenosyltransferase [Natronobeatus ordinarius]|uniref:cob(I)yrinic acid a,c-diamide adenosyltransferase n=1 Tax=Natronobeatus ordinarius TaxID=2963433 RepID=UPI0020CC0504|nr:cob(I)yrinic acid a,c-diamide adenosyltransferase [Natronobeatus ordinarius]